MVLGFVYVCVCAWPHYYSMWGWDSRKQRLDGRLVCRRDDMHTSVWMRVCVFERVHVSLCQVSQNN